MESTPYSLLKPFDNGNDGWINKYTVKLDKELRLALKEEQVELLLASAFTSLSPRSVEALQDEIWSRECSEPTSGRLEELQDASRRDTLA
jgi:hypothetical protein